MIDSFTLNVSIQEFTRNTLAYVFYCIEKSDVKVTDILIGKDKKVDCRLSVESDKKNNIDKLSKIVCLCGSTRFYKQFQRLNYEETMNGNIVLSVGFYPHSSKEVHGENIGYTKKQKEKLDQLHMRKIDMADEIFIINVGGYIGESTKKEIEYAKSLGKKIRWYENV